MDTTRGYHEYMFDLIQQIWMMNYSPTIELEEYAHTCDSDYTHV